jgi:hypothetical protein
MGDRGEPNARSSGTAQLTRKQKRLPYLNVLLAMQRWTTSWGRDDATLHVLVGDPFAVLACEPVAEDFVHAGELGVDSDALVIIADCVPGTNSTAAATSR